MNFSGLTKGQRAALQNLNVIPSVISVETTDAAPEVPIADIVNPGSLRISPGTDNSIARAAQERPVFDAVQRGQVSLDTFLYQTYGNDSIEVGSLSIENEQFQPRERDGISSFRPEIIGVVDFLPVSDGGKITPAGSMLDFQRQALLLRRRSLVSIFDQIRGTQKKDLEKIRSHFQKGLQKIDTSLSILQDVLSVVDEIKASLDVKNYPSSFFSLDTYKSVRDLFLSDLQFGHDSFHFSSNTKLFLQLIHDMKSFIEDFSYGLFSIEDRARKGIRPVQIENTTSLKEDFLFEAAQIRSLSSPINATKGDFFNGFIGSLPENPDDRIKLLVNLISKEMRVSKAMGTRDVQNLLQTEFNQSPFGNPFTSIIGEPVGSIFSTPAGEGSLASLSFIQPSENVKVLPFESKYVDFSSGDVFVPGSEFLGESIVRDGTDSFNTQAFTRFVEEYTRISSKARTSIMKLLSLDTPNSLRGDKIIDDILTTFKGAIDGMTTSDAFNKNQLLVTAALNLSNSDLELKRMLFQLCILFSLSIASKLEQKTSVDSFLVDIQRNLQNMSFVKLEGGESPFVTNNDTNYSQIISRLANDIELRVLRTIQPSISLPRPGVLDSQIPRRTTESSTSPGDSVTIPEVVSFLPGDLAAVLTSEPENPLSAASTALQAVTSIYLRLTGLAGENNQPIFTLDDGSRRTRWNFLSSTTIALVIFEVVCSLTEKYTFTTFLRGPGVPQIQVFSLKNKAVEESINRIIPIAGVVLDNSIPSTTLSVAPSTAVGVNSRNRFFRKLSPGSSEEPSNEFNATSFGQIFANVLPRSDEDRRRFALNLNVLDSLDLGFDQEFVARPQIYSDYQFLNQLVAIKDRLKDENRVILNLLHVLEVVEKRLQNAGVRTRSNLTTGTIRSFLALGNTTEDLRLIRNRSSVRTSRYINQKHRIKLSAQDEVSRSNNFVVFDVLDDAKFASVINLFSQNNLTTREARRRYRVVTVGLPDGFSKQLSERVSGDDLTNTSFMGRQFDVISVNVYKRDNRLDELVFKPKKFLFDLSLYPDPSPQPSLSTAASFEQTILSSRLLDLDETTSDFLTLDLMAKSDEYDFLDRDSRRLLFENHVKDDLLKTYLRLLSGTDLSEQSYTYEDLSELRDQYDPIFERVLREHILFNTGIRLPNVPVDELMTDTSIPLNVRDMIQLSFFGNILAKPKFLQRLVIGAKKFDRTFSLLLDLEGFEIDEELTRETVAGRRLLANEEFRLRLDQASLDRGILRLDRSREDLRFEDFFVAVETL